MTFPEPASDSEGASPVSATHQDAELVRAILLKDRKATAEFVSLYSDAIYSYVRRRLIPRVDLVDDLVQDVFLAALGSLAGFAGTSSLRTWLLGIARHKVEDYYRDCLRLPTPLSDLDETRHELRQPLVEYPRSTGRRRTTPARPSCAYRASRNVCSPDERVEQLNLCKMCHARVLGEHVEGAPIFWHNCPYVDFQKG